MSILCKHARTHARTHTYCAGSKNSSWIHFGSNSLNVSEEFPVLQLIVASQMTEQFVVDNQQKSVCCANPEKKKT